jgi:hypothetical protein
MLNRLSIPNALSPGRRTPRWRWFRKAMDLRCPSTHERFAEAWSKRIISAATQTGTDWIVLGVDEEVSSLPFRDSNAYKVIVAAKCGVLTIRHNPQGVEEENSREMYLTGVIDNGFQIYEDRTEREQCTMRCTNLPCKSETMYFRGGSLDCLDRSQESPTGASGEQRELVWLCPDCTNHFVVETWRSPGQQLRERRGPSCPLPANQLAQAA